MLCLFVIGDFVWFGLRKKIGDLLFFFFFISCCGMVVVVVAVVVAVADGRGGYGWCCGFFWEWDILFYCSDYIILL